MSTLFSVFVFFVLFGAMFGLPVMTTVMFIRHRESRLQLVLREIKKQYKFRGRGRAQLIGRIAGKPVRITRDVRRGVVVSVDLLPAEVRRRHAQWPRERAQAFSTTLRRLLAHCGSQARVGERIEGRWNFALGAYPTIDAIEDALARVRQGLSQEVLLAEVAASATEPARVEARSQLVDISESPTQPVWLRAEAYKALIGQVDDEQELEGFGARLADASDPALRRLSAVAWNRIEGPRAAAPLRSLLRDEHPTVVETAASILARRSERSDPDAEAVLLQRLRSESGPLLFVIVRALGALGSSRALAEMGRWCDTKTMNVTLREAVWRESSRIRAALGLTRHAHGGHLSEPPAGGELSRPKDLETAP